MFWGSDSVVPVRGTLVIFDGSKQPIHLLNHQHTEDHAVSTFSIVDDMPSSTTQKLTWLAKFHVVDL